MGLPSLVLIQAERARRQAERARGSAAKAAQESLAEFVRQGWHVVDPTEPLVWNWHLDLLCAHLEAIEPRHEIRKLLINVPPGTMKSRLVCVFWPAWVWLHNPGWRAVFASYDIKLAERDSLACRDVILSEWYQETFRPTWKLRRDHRSKKNFGNTAGGWRMCTTVRGAGTGLRAHAVVVDDPHNVKARPTDVEFADTEDWWFKRMGNRLIDQKRDAHLVIGQRIDDRDLSAACKRRGGYVHVCLPSEFDPVRRCKTRWGRDPRKRQGQLLFPKRFPKSVLDEERTNLGPDGYAAQHDQDPVRKGGNIIQEQWIGYWYKRTMAPPPVVVPAPDTTDKVVACAQRALPEMDFVIASWDLRFGKSIKETSSWVVGQVWGVSGPNAFLLDWRRGRWGYVRSKEEIRAVHDEWSPHATLIEAKASGEPAEDDLSADVPRIILVPTGGADKEQRLQATTPWFKAHNVYLRHPLEEPRTREVVEELVRFPFFPSNDHVDTCSQALNYLRTGMNSLRALAALAKG